ncbi:MAG: CRISPR-associated protein Cas4 [Candidatus Cloacimonetes bacterium]|nr:CRISPR-associated protein Cas4 [Candidatus Cloacimonadota bacterium]
MTISGSLIQAYMICPRQAWLMSRQICGDKDNDFLAIGRFYSEESFKRDKKEIIVDDNKIDLIREDNGELVLIETKKSSKMIRASRAQVLNYLYTLENLGHFVRGEIRIPKEKKVIPVPFGDAEKREIEKIRAEITHLIRMEKAPEVIKISSCKKCSYCDFCWS